jgi:PAS domain-containing protein
MDESTYAETILNVVLDEIDDIVLIHDSEHTLVWMNRAGLKEFGVKLDDIIGKRCYSLFGRNYRCEDCDVVKMQFGGSKAKRVKVIPHTGHEFICTSIPLYQDGHIRMVVQHLSRQPRSDVHNE